MSIDPRIGTDLLGYRIDALVGRGGMGVVYRAHNLRLKRNVALKLIVPELSGDVRFRERFLAETELAASLEHPNVVPIHDAGEVDGQLFIAMRYVEGSDLKTLLDEEGSLEPARALAILGQVAAALDAAHARGLVHRDVKPSNVLLDEQEHVYLADFGLSRRLADPGGAGERGLSVGTPAYAAPEQIEGGDVDGRADVYSLGCVLYECLTGRVPFRRDSELGVLWAHLQEPPPRPSEHDSELSEPIDAVVATAMAKEPDRRYATCTELVRAAREALGVEQAPPRGIRRRTIAIAAAAVLIALAALAAGLTLALGGSGNAQPKPSLVPRINTVVRINPETNTIAAVLKVGRDPENVAYGGTTLWVYNNADHTVEGIDTSTNEIVVPPTAISGTAPIPLVKHPIAADERGAWVLSVGASGGLLTHVPLDVPSTVEYPLPDSPVSIALGQGSIWVTTTSLNTGAVLRIDARTGRVEQRLAIPHFDGTPNWIAVGERYIWLTDFGEAHSRLYRVDPRTMQLTGRRSIDCFNGSCEAAVGRSSVWVATSPNEGVLVGEARSRLLRIDPATLQVTGVVPAPRADLGTDFTLDGTSIWWNGDAGGTGATVRVDTRTSKTVATIPIRLTDHPTLYPGGPGAIVTGGGSVWTAIGGAPR